MCLKKCILPFLLLNTVCYGKCIRYLPSITDVDHHSGMQTLYHGCELFGASIFSQQLQQSSPPNGVECLREFDKYNIQRSTLLYVDGVVAGRRSCTLCSGSYCVSGTPQG